MSTPSPRVATGTPCPVCGGTRRSVALRHPQGTLARCRGCGLVSVHPLPDPAAALAQYDASYFRGGTGYRDYEGEEAVFRAEFRRRLTTLAAAGARGRLLDVGCASGAFLLEAQAAGFAVTGIEPAPDAARTARARANAPVHAGPVESADLAPASFDVVTCFDALEHVVDPVAALRRFRGWLRPEGLLALTVPDFGGLWARVSGKRWPFVTPTEHLHYFTRRTLARALAAAGFSPPRFARASTPLSFGSAARKALGPLGPAAERALGPRAAAGFGLPAGTLFALARRPEPRR